MLLFEHLLYPVPVMKAIDSRNAAVMKGVLIRLQPVFITEILKSE
jgi:hypothetical protein